MSTDLGESRIGAGKRLVIESGGALVLDPGAEFRIDRDDNLISGDVLFKSFDFHYQIGGNTPFGSRQEYIR